jgi:hypothetical protein
VLPSLHVIWKWYEPPCVQTPRIRHVDNHVTEHGWLCCGYSWTAAAGAVAGTSAAAANSAAVMSFFKVFPP